MKITVEAPDHLLAQIRTLAEAERSEIDTLVEEALLRLLRSRASISLHDGGITPFQGDGLTCTFADATWSDILEASYQRLN